MPLSPGDASCLKFSRAPRYTRGHGGGGVGRGAHEEGFGGDFGRQNIGSVLDDYMWPLRSVSKVDMMQEEEPWR